MFVHFWYFPPLLIFNMTSLAYRSGVTKGVTAPTHTRFLSGLSTVFSLGVMHDFEPGAIIQNVAGLHISIRHFSGTPSISTQIAALRRLLLDPLKGAWTEWLKLVVEVVDLLYLVECFLTIC